MKIHLFILCMLAASLLDQKSLRASEALKSDIQELSSPTHTPSFMTQQIVADRLSPGLFRQKSYE